MKGSISHYPDFRLEWEALTTLGTIDLVAGSFFKIHLSLLLANCVLPRLGRKTWHNLLVIGPNKREIVLDRKGRPSLGIT